MTPLQKLRDKVIHIISYFSIKVIPERTRRLVFLASLAVYVNELETFNNETLRKLNTVMNLCNEDSAMELPIYLSHSIWKGKTAYDIFNDQIEIIQNLDKDRIRDMSVHAANSMPEWLQYGTSTEIIRDVEKLLNNFTLFNRTLSVTA